MKAHIALGLVLAGIHFGLPHVFAAGAENAKWSAGVATIDITPEGSVWMAGYGFRNKPSEGISQHLFAKALAIADGTGNRIVMVTLDLIGVPRTLREKMEVQLRERHGLEPESILLNASHTHSGPSPYGRGVTDPAFVAKAEAYGRMLEEKVAEVIGHALGRLEPASLSYSHARAGFAMNRRLQVGTEIKNSPNPDGPVDHDVPVLRVTGTDGKMRAILFGYACHNTTTGFYTINADYAGFAQTYLEQAHPGVTALFMMGAGGDQNPYPRSVSLEQTAQHGRALANGVEAALSVATPRPINGPLRSGFGHADLEYADADKSALERRGRSRDAAEKKRAEELLAQLASATGLPRSYPCPVQVVQFGRDLTLIAIGGETTVEYSLRLKRELAQTGVPVWVAGYSNDVFGYLGSRRIIIEGGYEGYSANFNRHPGPWRLTSEDRVIEKAHDLIRSINH